MGKNLIIGLVAVFFLYSGVVLAANLLTNPGFEDPVVGPDGASVYKTPTGWRVPAGWLSTGLYMVKLGTYVPTEGVQRVSFTDSLLVQDVEPIEAHTVYTFSIDLLPSDNGGTYQFNGRISLRIFDGDKYIVLTSSEDFKHLSLPFAQWSTLSISWDSTDYPKTWGKPLAAAIAVYPLCRYHFDDCSLTKAASTKKIGIGRDLPEGIMAVSENGATYSFDVKLYQAPTSNVSVVMEPNNPIDPNNNPQVNFGAGTVTFTPANWNIAQTVTVSAIDDAVSEPVFIENINFSVLSSDPAYNADPNGAPAPLAFKVVDNDGIACQFLYNGSFEIPALPTEGQELWGLPAAGWADILCSRHIYLINPLPTSAIQPTDGVDRMALAFTSDIMQPIGSLIEAHTGYIYSLDVYGTFPSSTTDTDDKIKIACYDGTTEIIDPNNLTVLAQNDYPEPSATARWTRVYVVWHSDSAPQYVGKKLAVIGTAQRLDVIMDNATVTQTYVNLVETDNTTELWERASLGNTTDTYSIVLSRQPADDVVITATPPSDAASIDLGAGMGVPVTLTFTSSNWQTPQTITVSAIDDLVNEGATPIKYFIKHSMVSSDPYFSAAFVKDVKVSVHDDDYPSLLLTGAANLAISEEGATSVQYDVSLLIAPTADVTVSLTASADVTVVPSTLTFTTVNWAAPQIVTVTAVDDELTEGNPEIVTITHATSSTDTQYVLVPVNVNVTVAENDFCGNWGFYPGDINEDCKVDLTDFQMLAFRWLECTNPQEPLLCAMP